MPFKPGQSGNPSGRKKVNGDIIALAKKYTVEAIKTLIAVMQDENAPAASRVTASNAILDRAYGKPAQSITGPEGGPIAITVRWEE